MDGHFTLYHLSVMSLYVFFISIFLLIIDFFAFHNNKLQQQLEEVRAINTLLEERQEHLQQESETSNLSTPAPLPTSPGRGDCRESEGVTITGQGVDATLEVNPLNIIYIESMANYADICYIADNETKHTTLRITLKQIRDSLSSVDCIVQSHRAFLVNINFVLSVTTHNSSYQMQMFGMEKTIPVSRANVEEIKKRLKNGCRSEVNSLN